MHKWTHAAPTCLVQGSTVFAGLMDKLSVLAVRGQLKPLGLLGLASDSPLRQLSELSFKSKPDHTSVKISPRLPIYLIAKSKAHTPD